MTASNHFARIIHSHPDGTPWTATMGVSVVPGLNAYGAWVTILPGLDPGGGLPYLSHDCYEIELYVHNSGAANEAKGQLITIGLDPLGGTAFADFIEYVPVPHASTMLTAGAMGGFTYRFRIFVAAGTSIGARATASAAPLRQARTFVRVKCEPSNPELIRCGTYARTFGAVAASSKGTDIVVGTAAEGAWTELGTIADADLWQWNVGLAVGNTALDNAVILADLGIGDATTKDIVIAEQPMFTTSGELATGKYYPEEYPAEVGQKVYARGETSTTQTTIYSAIAIAVGGDAAGTGGQLTVGGETDPPVLGVVTPDQNEAPGTAGAFSATWATATATPITMAISDAASDLAFISVWASFASAAGASQLVYAGRPDVDGDAGFVAPFTRYSTIDATDPADVSLSLRHDTGWPGNGTAQQTITLDYAAVDAAGNVLAGAPLVFLLPPSLTGTTTLEAIMDRLAAIIVDLEPESETAVRFRRHEGKVDFRDWAEKHSAGCYRAFDVRDTGEREPPAASNMDVEDEDRIVEVVIAYPSNSRYGSGNDRDRDAVIDQDAIQVEDAVGTNSSGSVDNATMITEVALREDGSPVTFSVIRLRAYFSRAKP